MIKNNIGISIAVNTGNNNLDRFNDLVNLGFKHIEFYNKIVRMRFNDIKILKNTLHLNKIFLFLNIFFHVL